MSLQQIQKLKQREYQKKWLELNKEHIREYRRSYHQKNKERFNFWRMEWRKRNRLKENERRRQRNIRLREKCFDLLGHVCVRCGFSDKRALQFDHINGGGTKERKNNRSIDVYVLILKRNGIGYQTLCANCNWIKGAAVAA